MIHEIKEIMLNEKKNFGFEEQPKKWLQCFLQNLHSILNEA